ncbi:MAG: hypothetical protein J2P36_01880, partial [Ktedonobacteraceae bacterium]|nr:hypothetical protein [Ktedonobacteraceae bacterium]
GNEETRSGGDGPNSSSEERELSPMRRALADLFGVSSPVESPGDAESGVPRDTLSLPRGIFADLLGVPLAPPRDTGSDVPRDEEHN